MTKWKQHALVGLGTLALGLLAVGCGGSEIQYGSGYATTPVYTTGYAQPQPVYYNNGGTYYAPGYAGPVYYGPRYRGRAYAPQYRGRAYAAPQYRGRAYAAPQGYRGRPAGRVVVQPAPRRGYGGPGRVVAPRGGRVVVRPSAPARGGVARPGGGFRGGRGAPVRGGSVRVR
ncbi:MAG: hypothetical protein R3B82_16360 [Sandaracinaceae bacterium]